LDLEEKISSTNSLTADRSKASPVKDKKIEMIISESEDSVGKSHVFSTPTSQSSEEETPVVESPVFRQISMADESDALPEHYKINKKLDKKVAERHQQKRLEDFHATVGK
jgi:hypothetical protein